MGKTNGIHVNDYVKQHENKPEIDLGKSAQIRFDIGNTSLIISIDGDRIRINKRNDTIEGGVIIIHPDTANGIFVS
jgi:hypothetical protein